MCKKDTCEIHRKPEQAISLKQMIPQKRLGRSLLSVLKIDWCITDVS